ncbi:unnamed protein product [Blepharisma stoltei]|uniref:Uncharacterized protein n=1 Tax=Blepharisma stoltei TaxID=1481888 RepID=A0AAU9J2H3_9CILI|nr:unnamed protein product [Blepharisma stoltei]
MRRHKLNLKTSFLKKNSSKAIQLKQSVSRQAIQEKCMNELIGMVMTKSNSNQKFKKPENSLTSTKCLQNTSPIKAPSLGLGFPLVLKEEIPPLTKIYPQKITPKLLNIKPVQKFHTHYISGENLPPAQRSQSCTPGMRRKLTESRLNLRGIDSACCAVQCDSKSLRKTEREASKENSCDFDNDKERSPPAIIRRSVYTKIKKLENDANDMKFRISHCELMVPSTHGSSPIDQNDSISRIRGFSPSRIKKLEWNWSKSNLTRSKSPKCERRSKSPSCAHTGVVITPISSSINITPRTLKRYYC